VKVLPRRPAKIDPGAIKAWPAGITPGALSLLSATLIVIVFAAVSKNPQSAAPLSVEVIEPSKFLFAVPYLKVCTPDGSVMAWK
jgi:hypothetical protein